MEIELTKEEATNLALALNELVRREQDVIGYASKLLELRHKLEVVINGNTDSRV